MTRPPWRPPSNALARELHWFGWSMLLLAVLLAAWGVLLFVYAVTHA